MPRLRHTHTPRRRFYLALEFGVLFLAVPLTLVLFRKTFGSVIVPSLVLLGVGCTLALLRDPRFKRRRLWNRHEFWPRLARTMLRFLPLALAVAGLTAWLAPHLLFSLPRQRPVVWIAVMILYPVLSVYPQEVIFRTFFFHRYRALFRHRVWIMAASGVAFGIAHLFFNNWIAPAMTTVGGVLFAQTYARTGSTLQAGLEHALWGNFLFTIGLGWYFYGGSIG